MKIKKSPGAASASPAGTGGAAIADRFKLENVEASASSRTVGRKSAMCALIAGLVGLALSGALTFVLYQHWEFLKSA